MIDEPTNHLDMVAREIVSAYLNTKTGFILVSHDRNFLDSCVDHILSINKANIEIHNGNFSSWYYNKQLQDDYERERNKELTKSIAHLKEAARRTAEWSDRVEATKIGFGAADRGRIGHLAAKMMKRSKAIEKRRYREIEEKSKLLKNIESADHLKVSFLSFHSQRLITVDKLSLFYGTRSVCENVTFHIDQGDRLGILGKNGSGKTSIIKLILGEEGKIRYSGNFEKKSGLILSYISQDTSYLQGDLKEYAIRQEIDESLFKAILRKLDFSRIQFEKDMSNLSEGQKKKILIARSLCERAHLYIWDEPLNYIDILSRIQIKDLIVTYKPTILFVEHDKAFCTDIATKTVCL